MAAANRADLEAIEATLQQFRVNELHILLATFKCPKLGKKNELVQRCINLLQNARNQAAVIQKIREISSTRRYNTLGIASTPSTAIYSHHTDGNTAMNGTMYDCTLSSALMQQQQQYFNAHPFSAQLDRAKCLPIVDLPFYDRLTTILDMTELPGNISGIRSTSRVAFTFFIPKCVSPHIQYRNDYDGFPRMELQLRFFLMDHSTEQQDDFPPNCSVKIDDAPVTLPNIIPTNKPNAEPKRPSRPVNITPYCQPPRETVRPHRIAVEWVADKRAWVMCIFAVSRLSAGILQGRLLENVNARRDAADTRRMIKSRLAGDDDAIQMETLRISLLCPLGKTRMVIPVKPYDCTHLQCFDLSNFLLMNEKRPTWKCAVCDNGAPYKKLVIDGYFETVLKETNSDTTEVELLRDGGWRPVVEEVETLSDDDDDEIVSASGSKTHSHQSARSSTNRPNSNADDDVIVLDSSDDDADEMSRMQSEIRNYTSRPQRGTVSPPIVCIDLDDSDPAALSPQQSFVPSTPSSSNSDPIVVVNASTSSLSVPVTAIGAPLVAVAVGGGGGNVQQHYPVAQRPYHHHHQQQQHQPFVNQPSPYFLNPAVPAPVPPLPEAVMPGAAGGTTSSSAAAGYYHPFEQPYPFYGQEYNTRVIAEELRQFMANIQQSNTNAANYPRYS